MATSYFGIRVAYTHQYMSLRGYNRATAAEEFMKLLLVVLVISGASSSLRIMGVHKLPMVQKFIPKKFK